MKIRCIAKEPYSPPEDMVGVRYAPWQPGEEKNVDDVIGARLVADGHFVEVKEEPVHSTQPKGKTRQSR